MKSLDENELFDELGNRLRDYSELPDEQLWDKIAAATAPRWVSWADRTTTIFSLATLVVLLFNSKPGESRISSATKNQIAATVPDVQQALEESRHNLTFRNISEVVGSAHGLTEKHTIVAIAGVSGADRADTGNNFTEVVKPSTKEKPDSVEKISKLKPDSAVQIKIPGSIKKVKRGSSGLSLYFVITPGLSYNAITPLTNDGYLITGMSNPGPLSLNRFGIAFDAGIQGRISNRFEYYGGLSYYQQDQVLHYSYTDKNIELVESSDNSLTFSIQPETKDVRMSYRMKNVGLQAGVLFTLKDGPIKQKLGAGLAWQHGMLQKSTDGVYENISSSYLLYQLLYRNEFALTPYLKGFVQPNFSYTILSQETLGAPFKSKPYRAGIGIGIIYSW